MLYMKNKIENITNESHNISEKNRVTIRVWRSAKEGGASFGHASLQIDELYISFWPDDDPNFEKIAEKFDTIDEIKEINLRDPLMIFSKSGRAIVNEGYTIFRKVKGVYLNSVELDNLFERREAEFICSLYSLDTSSMKSKFFKLTENTKDWTMLGRGGLIRFGSWNAQNCSGIVREVLEAGGINELGFRPENSVDNVLKTKKTSIFGFFPEVKTEFIQNPFKYRETKLYYEDYKEAEEKVKIEQKLYWDEIYSRNCKRKDDFDRGDCCDCYDCGGLFEHMLYEPHNRMERPLNKTLDTFYTTPSDVERFVKVAKRNELLKYPETKFFDTNFGSEDYFSSNFIQNIETIVNDEDRVSEENIEWSTPCSIM